MFRILVPLDGSPAAEAAISMACAIAGDVGGTVELLTVRTAGRMAATPSQAPRKEPLPFEEGYVRRAAEQASGEFSCAVFHRTLTGRVADVICDHARTSRASLIVMTTHGRTGFSRAWLGSVADAVVRQSVVPVLMLRPEQIRVPALKRGLRHFVVPLDGSAVAEAILEPVLAQIASADEASLTLVQIVRPVMYYSSVPSQAYSVLMPIVDEQATQGLIRSATTYLEGVAKRLGTRAHARIETRVVQDDRVATAILALAEESQVDAIALTTHGRGASRLLVGSVADKVLRGVATPLLLYRPPKRKSSAAPKLARRLKRSQA